MIARLALRSLLVAPGAQRGARRRLRPRRGGDGRAARRRRGDPRAGAAPALAGGGDVVVTGAPAG